MTQIEEQLLKLGWLNVGADLWRKERDVFSIEVPLETAILLELELLYDTKKSTFQCPDCGYKVGFLEFINPPTHVDYNCSNGFDMTEKRV